MAVKDCFQTFPITLELSKVQKSTSIENKIDVIISKIHNLSLSNKIFCLNPYLLAFS